MYTMNARVLETEPMPPQIDESAQVALRAAAEVLGPEMPMGHWVQVAHTAEGDEAVRLILLFPASRISGISGTQLIDILGRVESAMLDIGETRTPLISFARIEDRAELEGA